ncbi:hypothetical protein DFAR_2300001 [Desulfarculales bacterium]
MLINPILDKLRALRLKDMLKALKEQLDTPEAQELDFGRLPASRRRGLHP